MQILRSLASGSNSGGRAKVIAVSAVGDTDPLAQGLEVDAFIDKPFDIEQGLSAVKSHVA